MIRKQLQDVLDALPEQEYRTAGDLARRLGISEKTVRIRIKELNQELGPYGACIVSKARFGYKLCVEDSAAYGKLLPEDGIDIAVIPETGEERNQYLLAYLINQKDYVKIDDLAEFLYVSRGALRPAIQYAESTLRRYGISLERRANYGIRVRGRELDIRRLVGECYIKRDYLGDMGKARRQQEIEQLASRIRKLLVQYEIHLPEIAFENFLDYVYVAQKRMGKGFYLTLDEEQTTVQIDRKEQLFLKELVSLLEETYGPVYTEDEKKYLLLYLAGKKIVGNAVENDSNFIIHERTDRLALAMLDEIEKEYQINFRSNFDVRMTLNQHLTPFEIRIRYDIPLHNPLLEDIKEKYSLAYDMAYRSARVLKEYFRKEISEDEIGYFALIFALALEEHKQSEKFNILVVCSTGKGSSRLLKYKYEHEFAEYLNNIYVCDLPDLETFDFHTVDYVFTTVPISAEIPVPIMEVGAFLENSDIQRITETLKKGKKEYLYQYYKPHRFLRMEAGTKDEILKQICDVIKAQEEVDPDFYELVMERETYVQMDYGNGVAIPHPNRIASEETFVYVAVLDQPVVWTNLPVQVILLTSIGRREDANRQKFYEATARFALDESSVQKLAAIPEYAILMDLLQR